MRTRHPSRPASLNFWEAATKCATDVTDAKDRFPQILETPVDIFIGESKIEYYVRLLL